MAWKISFTIRRNLVRIGPAGEARVLKGLLSHLEYSRKILRLVAAGVVCSATQTWADQMFVVSSDNTVGEYTTSGTTINPALVSGLSSPQGVAVSGGHLFITNAGSNTIGEYDARTGAVINPALISGLHQPSGIAIIGNTLFVANSGNGTIGKYTTSGATIDSTLISHVFPLGIAVSGNDLFVTNAGQMFGAPTVGKFTLSGETVDRTFIGGFTLAEAIAASGGYLYISDPEDNSIRKYTTASGSGVDSFRLALVGAPGGIAVSEGSLFVTYADRSGVIGEYDAGTGSAINPALVSGLTAAAGIAVVSTSVAETGATLALLCGSLVAILALKPFLLRRV